MFLFSVHSVCCTTWNNHSILNELKCCCSDKVVRLISVTGHTFLAVSCVHFLKLYLLNGRMSLEVGCVKESAPGGMSEHVLEYKYFLINCKYTNTPDKDPLDTVSIHRCLCEGIN